MTWSASSEILLVIVCLVSIVFGRCNFGTAPFLNVIYAELTTTSVTHGWQGVSVHDAYYDMQNTMP